MTLTLYSAPTSPFARKVRILIHELGLGDDVEEVQTDPWASEPDFLVITPLSKVPTLVTEEGEPLPDSRNIADYLLSYAAHQGRGLPEPAGDPWADRRRRQYADGVLDAAVLANREQRRDVVLHSWFDRQIAAVVRTLDRLEDESNLLIRHGGIGETEISLVAALGYLDLRLPGIGWRSGRPRLADWFDAIRDRPSVSLTAPPLA